MNARSNLDPEAISRAARAAAGLTAFSATFASTFKSGHDACYDVIHGDIAVKVKNATDEVIFGVTAPATHAATYTAVVSCLLKEKP